MDEKYRKLKVSNAAFQRRVSNVNGGLDMLKAIGFQEATDFYIGIRSELCLRIEGGSENGNRTSSYTY